MEMEMMLFVYHLIVEIYHLIVAIVEYVQKDPTTSWRYLRIILAPVVPLIIFKLILDRLAPKLGGRPR